MPGLEEAQVWLGAAGVLTLCGVNLARAAFRRTPFGALQPQDESSASSSGSEASPIADKSSHKATISGSRLSVPAGEENEVVEKVGKKRQPSVEGGEGGSFRTSKRKINEESSIVPSRTSTKPSEDSQICAVAPPRRSRKTDSHQAVEEDDGMMCKLLDRPISELSIEKHRTALTNSSTVTVKALRNILAGMGSSVPSSALKDAMIDMYLENVRGRDATTVPATTTKRKSTTRASEVVEEMLIGAEEQSMKMSRRSVVQTPAAATDRKAAAATKRQAIKAACPASPGDIVTLDRMKFEIGDILATGADSTIFKGRCVEGKKAGLEVAVKMQPRSRKTVYQVTTEYTTLRALLAKPNSNLHIQTPIAYGCHNDEAYVLVTELLGPNVSSLISKNQTVPTRTVLLLALQGIPLLEALHSNGYVHRDIKPDNIVICSNKGCDQLFLIDFGTAESLFDRKGVRKTTPQAAEGTLAYMAVSVHKGLPFSPRDDLEAYGWMLMRLLLGRLPWEDYSPQQMAQIAAAKTKVMANPDLKGLSVSMKSFFKGYFAYCSSLDTRSGVEHSKELQALVQQAWAADKQEYGSLPTPSRISFR